MLRVNINFIVYRYEAILAIIIILLTGSIAVSSRDSERVFSENQKYPFKIALTFDDGPHKVFTEKLLDVLVKERVTATFFVVGTRMLENPKIARCISDLGFEIDGHTYSHRNMSRLSKDDLRLELDNTRSLIKTITGQHSSYFRPPGGQYNNMVISVADSLGYSMILWTVFPKDHEENDPNVIAERVLAQANDGGVILLHSGRLPTIAALPKIIKELRARGYQFVTVSQLCSTAPLANQNWIKHGPNFKAKV